MHRPGQERQLTDSRAGDQERDAGSLTRRTVIAHTQAKGAGGLLLVLRGCRREIRCSVATVVVIGFGWPGAAVCADLQSGGQCGRQSRWKCGHFRSALTARWGLLRFVSVSAGRVTLIGRFWVIPEEETDRAALRQSKP
jgi:hypothetical protein